MPTPAQRLIHAVRTTNHERVKELLREHNDVNVRSAAGRTALHAAAEEGDREAARILIEAGADVNVRMHTAQTPLHLAAAYGGFCDLADPDADRRDPCNRNRHHPTNIEVAKAITEIIKARHPQLPSELQAQDKFPEENKAEIFLAALECFADPTEFYQAIKSRGIDIDHLDPHFAEQLLGKPRFLTVVEFLLDHGADIRALNDTGESVLQGAVELGRPEMVELLLKRGADPNPQFSPDEPPASLIATALEYSKTDVADILLRYGARFDPETSWALHGAAGNGQEKVVMWLLDHGTDINLRDDEGNTPLLAAARSGHDNIVASLIASGADVRVRNAQGTGILHAAASWHRCLEHVVRLGLPVDEPDEEGKTALHQAAHCGDPLAIRVLLRHGASITVRDRHGNTPLHCIFLSDEFRPDVEFPVFHAIVSAGADRSVRNEDGKTAFDMAAEYRYPEEYFKLLDPVAATDPAQFLWLGDETYAGFLSRAMIALQLDGAEWPSAEHYFHAHKTQDPEIREQIRQAKTIDAAICRLRELQVEPSRTWPRRCDDVMRAAQLEKFRQHDDLRRRLLATGNAILISDAHCDSYWLEKRGAKFNHLGKMLMDIRDQLRAECGGKEV